MTIKKYDYLPEEASKIRNEVFVEEQGFVEELDAMDAVCTHLLLFEGEQPVATCRYFWDEERKSYIAGRIAVVKEYRGKALGAAILREAETQIEKIGGQRLSLAAQVRAAGFYEKQGYVKQGEEFYEEYCPHIWMCKELRNQ